MIPFVGNIVGCKFTNEKNDMVEVLYRSGSKVLPYHVSVLKEDHNFQALLDEGWDLNRIEKSTSDVNRLASRAFNQVIKVHLTEVKKKMQKVFDEKMITLNKEVNKSEIFKTILQNDTDEEQIFKLKLAIFDLDVVRKIKNRSKKLKIRKAKTILRALVAYSDLVENLDEE